MPLLPKSPYAAGQTPLASLEISCPVDPPFPAASHQMAAGLALSCIGLAMPAVFRTARPRCLGRTGKPVQHQVIELMPGAT